MTAPAYGDVAVDLCAHLADLGVGQWAPNGVYRKTTPPPIYLGIIPDEARTAIAVNVYADDRLRDDASPDVYVQIRVKGDRDPRTASRIADRIFTHLHRQTHYTLNNRTSVLSSHRHLRAPEDRDTNQNWHRADSYTLTLNPH